jgi:hypothetical protein
MKKLIFITLCIVITVTSTLLIGRNIAINVNRSTSEISDFKQPEINAKKDITEESVKSVLTKDADWFVLKTEQFELGNKAYLAVCATYESAINPMVGYFFVYTLNEKGEILNLLWTSPAQEATSIINADLYMLKSKDSILLIGQLDKGGARGTMISVDIFTVHSDDNVRYIKSLDLGIGYIEKVEDVIKVEGELLDNNIEITYFNGKYKEEPFKE